MSISDQVLDIFRETGALLQGHFILTSGRHSASYFQCAKVLQHPEHLQLFANEISSTISGIWPLTWSFPRQWEALFWGQK